jgi:mono/diheme cytochrome c family protein
MNYPFWDVQIGYGILMAVIAITHVFVSHFAIGGGLYLVLAEHSARKRNDSQMLDYLQRLSKLFILVTLVFGALTGVGIWFIIGLLNPAGIEVLIRNFVWAWAIEWTFFAIEICAAILYFYGWKRMSARDHLVIGWIYFVTAWLSLFVINGIITFMLTPGEWLATGNFWDGFFNPTFWPSLVMRTGICIMLAGLYSMLIASGCRPPDFKTRIVRYNAAWGIIGLAVTLPCFYWYFKAIPAAITEKAAEMMATPMASLGQSYWYAGAIAILLVLFGFVIPKRQRISFALVTMIFGLAWFGAFEWFRESIRKPYVISGYMFGNGIEVAKTGLYEVDGYLQHMAFRTGDEGADLFRRACRSCHTFDGYKALKPALDGTDSEFIVGLIQGNQVIRGNMPQFYGTDIEVQKLAQYIYSKIDHSHISEIYGLEGVELGKKVFEIRCGKCHEFGGYNDVSESLVDMSDEEYHDLLDMAEDLGEEMPAFSGDQTERLALIEYLKSLEEGGSQ